MNKLKQTKWFLALLLFGIFTLSCQDNELEQTAKYDKNDVSEDLAKS